VVWGGEFGRMPVKRGRKKAATITPMVSWCGLPAAGIKGRGELLARPMKSATRRCANKVSIHDLHATMLHLLGRGAHAASPTFIMAAAYRLTDVGRGDYQAHSELSC